MRMWMKGLPLILTKASEAAGFHDEIEREAEPAGEGDISELAQRERANYFILRFYELWDLKLHKAGF